MSNERQRRLGRGLEALIPTSSSAGSATANDVRRIPLSSIRANPFQPRRDFRPDELAELEASLRASGLLQPISVRRRGEAYELIAGERRVRAATNLGWAEIQAIVRDFDDRTMLVLALVENLQRTNLNALEEARGYRRLIDEFQLTQQQVAEAVGKDRTTVTNLLRILALPSEILELVEQGSLSPGHARALLALAESSSAASFARSTVKEGLSVRELEQRVREANAGPNPDARSEPVPVTKASSPSAGKQQSPVLRSIEDDLRKYLQTDVRVSTSEANRGKIEISFFSPDDLERVLDLILRDFRAQY
ncbi:MAG TPA: ParB/RepB/Spo0J family partition protein [Gemmatimonadaceae bacterium]|jgi:ParB family chromosome partitioning protein|nr:ParB/RepB/Spo0J family partition protein [Gemmatimonadaceae bacterium]